MAIMVLTLLTISCFALEERLTEYGKSEWIDLQSENLLRKAEGVSIIAEEKIVEATQRLYDISKYRDDFKSKIESFSYRKKYISEIENLSDVNMNNIKIDVYRDDIAEDGSGLYKFFVYVTAFEKEYNMKREMMICVTMKNLLKEKPNESDTEKPNAKPEEDIPQKVDARDALIFRVEKE